MAGADASIYGMVRPQEKLQGPLDQYGAMLQLRSMIDSGELNDLHRQKLSGDLQEEQDFKARLTDWVKGGGSIGGGNPLPANLYAASPTRATALEEKNLAAQKSRGDIKKTDVETMAAQAKYFRDMLSGVTDQPSYENALGEGQKANAAWIKGAPAVYNPEWVRSHVMNADQFITQTTPKFEKVDTGGKIEMVDTNPVTNPAVKGMSFKKTQTPGEVQQANQPTWDEQRGVWVMKPPQARAPGAPAPQPGTTSPLQNRDGSVTTERSITVTDQRLNGGKPTNIPSVWGGKVVSDQEAIANAASSGRQWQAFGSIDEAVSAAKARSDSLGRGTATSIGGAAGTGGQPAVVRPAGLPPKPTDVHNLRNEFNALPEVKQYKDTLPIVEAARAAPDTRAGDIQLAYAVGKILDPNSVVREGELKMSADAQTAVAKYWGEIQSAVTGKGRLSPATRAELVKMLDSAVTQRETAFRASEATYRGIAEKNGIPADQVIIQPMKRTGQPGNPDQPKLFDKMPAASEYTGRRMQADDGTIYQSDGKRWVRQGAQSAARPSTAVPL